MDRKSNVQGKSRLLNIFSKHYSGPLAGVVLSALSAWTIVIGLKGLAGFDVNQQTALADLLGIALIIVAARWFTARK